MEELPASPASAIRTKIAELGYGSGPWSRAELAERWGDASANKLIAEAKDAGWLLAPFRDQYFVPAASDLMTVSWLPSLQRREFVISRTLAASGLRAWSLSAWASTEGLLFSEPIFVTDLSLATPPPPKSAREPGRAPAALAAQARDRAEKIKSVPFLENLVIVPVLGKLGAGWERSRLRLPSRSKKSATKAVTAAPGPGPASPDVIEYEVTRQLQDKAWLFAFLTALNIPRAREQLRKLAEAEVGVLSTFRQSRPLKDVMDRALRWAGSFGPASPNENWQAVLQSGVAPYLLVPPMIWDESLSLASSRMFDEMTKLRRGLDA